LSQPENRKLKTARPKSRDIGFLRDGVVSGSHGCKRRDHAKYDMAALRMVIRVAPEWCAIKLKD